MQFYLMRNAMVCTPTKKEDYSILSKEEFDDLCERNSQVVWAGDAGGVIAVLIGNQVIPDGDYVVSNEIDVLRAMKALTGQTLMDCKKAIEQLKKG